MAFSDRQRYSIRLRPFPTISAPGKERLEIVVSLHKYKACIIGFGDLSINWNIKRFSRLYTPDLKNIAGLKNIYVYTYRSTRIRREKGVILNHKFCQLATMYRKTVFRRKPLAITTL